MAEISRPVTMPAYRELPLLPESSERHAWNVWGAGDQRGSVNRIGQEQVRYAASLVTSGHVVPLSLPLNEPGPGLFAKRTPPEHVIYEAGHGRDDRLDGFFLQFSSQWDGLRHVRFRQYGFWNGYQDEDVDQGGKLGIEHWARHGIIGRGVLIDAAGYFANHGELLTADQCRRLGPADLDCILSAQSVSLRPGDILLLHTGWLDWYLGLDIEQRIALQGRVGRQPDPLQCPGLDAGAATAEWLWDHGIAAVASDNPTVEALPVDREIGFLHYRLLPLLGMPLGEFWPMGELAAHCAESGRYEFMMTSGVMNLPGGVGSPNNAYAIF
jgi:hypothetical protein